MSKEKKPSAFMKPVHVKEALAKIVGRGPMPRTEVTKKLWDYIKKHKLQDSHKKRIINPNRELADVLGSSQPLDMFEMTKLIAKQLSSEPELARSR
jgi:chromatin remodeling complex protein RSC6